MKRQKTKQLLVARLPNRQMIRTDVRVVVSTFTRLPRVLHIYIVSFMNMGDHLRMARCSKWLRVVASEVSAGPVAIKTGNVSFSLLRKGVDTCTMRPVRLQTTLYDVATDAIQLFGMKQIQVLHLCFPTTADSDVPRKRCDKNSRTVPSGNVWKGWNRFLGHVTKQHIAALQQCISLTELNVSRGTGQGTTHVRKEITLNACSDSLRRLNVDNLLSLMTDERFGIVVRRYPKLELLATHGELLCTPPRISLLVQNMPHLCTLELNNADCHSDYSQLILLPALRTLRLTIGRSYADGGRLKLVPLPKLERLHLSTWDSRSGIVGGLEFMKPVRPHHVWSQLLHLQLKLMPLDGVCTEHTEFPVLHTLDISTYKCALPDGFLAPLASVGNAPFDFTASLRVLRVHPEAILPEMVAGWIEDKRPQLKLVRELPPPSTDMTVFRITPYCCRGLL